MTTHQAPHHGQQFQQPPHAVSNRATGQMHHTGPPLSAANTASHFDHRHQPPPQQQHHYPPGNDHHHPGRNGAGVAFHRRNNEGLPLRIAVASKLVGAIIGQGGSCISEISRETQCRCIVDQSRNRNSAEHMPAEKVISIFGTPEGCSKACVKIIEIVRREMEKDHAASDEYELRIRAPNELVGRLIGKSGKTIKSIKNDTGAFVSVSNDPGSLYDLGPNQPYGNFAVERSITVRARDLEAISRAEHMISSNLRRSYETDIIGQKMYAPGAFGGLPIGPFMGIPGQPGISHAGGMFPYPATGLSRSLKLFVPNMTIGGLIGSKGAYIKKMIQHTGAQIRIDNSDYHREKRNTISSSDGDHPAETPEKPQPEEEVQKVPEVPEKESSEEKGPTPEEDSVGKAEEKSEVVEVPEKPVEEAPAALSPGASSDSNHEVGEKEKEHAKNATEGDRLVTITGMDHQLWNALYYIFDKVAEQVFCPLEELRLPAEITVPAPWLDA
ncbi:hypothetical protein L596_024333 [Steinernema carpocapsae]|uniref:K Homology domain-containing protein n=1 Tax=Steinernema carpocapsae TaxID=34508 RepID=A0A4U5MGG1_STECR|nr:hypothetical protein L596_024333 [Steinernema carpocapsae]